MKVRQFADYIKYQARRKGCFAVRVEGKDDVAFWYKLFNEILPNNRKPLIFSYSNAPKLGTTGKYNVLLFAPYVDENLVLCIDSDYDYLKQNDEVCDNPFIFQTYSYSIENIICQPHNLKRALQLAANEEDIKVDFDKIILKYSEAIYEILLLSIIDTLEISRRTCGKLAGLPQHFEDIEQEIEDLKKRLQEEVKAKKHVFHPNTVNYWKERLATLGFTRETAYLFIRGHNLFETCIFLINHFQREITAQKELEFEKNRNEKARIAYFSEVKSAKKILKKSWTIGDFPFYEKMREEIQNVFGNG